MIILLVVVVLLTVVCAALAMLGLRADDEPLSDEYGVRWSLPRRK